MTNRYTKLKEEKNSTRVARVKYVLVASFKGTIGLYFVALCTRKKNIQYLRVRKVMGNRVKIKKQGPTSSKNGEQKNLKNN